MLRQTWLITLGVLLLFGSLIGAALYVELQPTTLRIAVGPADGEDAHLVQAIAQQLTRDRATIRLKPVLKDSAIRAAPPRSMPIRPSSPSSAATAPIPGKAWRSRCCARTSW